MNNIVTFFVITSIMCCFIWVLGGAFRAQRSSNWTKFFFIMFGFPFFLLGSFLCYEQYGFQQRTTAKTQGTVTSFNSTYRKGVKCIAPVCSYRIQNNIFNCESSHYVSEKSSSYHLGAIRMVYYNPQNPKESRFDSFGETWILPLLFTIIGFAFLNVGIFFTFKNS
jgi:hypothetical protein